MSYNLDLSFNFTAQDLELQAMMYLCEDFSNLSGIDYS
jgi:hypothetical protein